MSIRDDDKDWLHERACYARLLFTDEQIEQFCDIVEAAVQRDDEPRWVAREFELKELIDN